MSDIHSNFNLLWAEAFRKFDILINTGDTFPNYPCYLQDQTRDRKREGILQTKWLETNHLQRLIKLLGGRPYIEVEGNHDATSVAQCLLRADYGNAHLVKPGELVEINSIRFAGFPQVPNLVGWYNYAETKKLVELGKEACALKPHVLLTHAPPMGILSCRTDWGIPELGALIYQNDSIRYHMFGHVHERGGLQQRYDDCTFINGANVVKPHELRF